MVHDKDDSPRLRHRLTVRLTGGVIIVLLLIGIPFLLAFHRLLREQRLETLEDAGSMLSDVLIDSLRSSMLAEQPHLLDDVVRNLSAQEGIERVVLLDHLGRVTVSSDPDYDGRLLERDRDALCSGCHRTGEEPPLDRTVVASDGDRRVLRAMSVIPNEPRCHSCHDSSSSNNGILLTDLDFTVVEGSFFADIGGTIALGSVMVIVTIGVLVMLLRRMVHAPLRAVVATSRRIVAGDLGSRASVNSSCEFGLLATQVNRMTDHLARLLDTVESQRRDLRSILDAVDDQIVVLDPDRRVVAANRAFRVGCGDPEGDFQGRFCHEVAGSHDGCAVDGGGECPVQRVFETGRLHKGILSLASPDGKERVIEIHASPLRGPDGRTSLAVEVRRDISERRQMEASLSQSERLASLGLLASGISHEINNPLGAIATSVEGLRRRLDGHSDPDAATPEILFRRLEGIEGQIQRARRITDRLLNLSRSDAGTRSLIDVNRIIEDIVAVLSHQMKHSGISARMDLAPGLPPLCGDESALGQVVMNIVMNAVQSMSERGGELSITTSSPGAVVQIEVRDQGCGIPPGLVKQIYEPFFTTKPPGKGTGLGLFMTHRIVSEWEGTIQVDSEEGRGTLFTVRLPRDRKKAS